MTEVCGEQLIQCETGFYYMKLLPEKKHIYLVQSSNSSFLQDRLKNPAAFHLTPFQSVLF